MYILHVQFDGSLKSEKSWELKTKSKQLPTQVS